MSPVGSAVRTGSVVLAALVLVTGCKPRQNDLAQTGNEAATPPAAMNAPAPESAMGNPSSPNGGAAAVSDPQIAQIALSASSGDSARGKLAETKATNAQVKSFAKEMVTDHTMLNKKAVELAQKLNVTPAESPADSDLVKKVGDMTNDLQGKTGKDFDKAYMDQEVQIHQLVLDDLDRNLIPGAQNAELKSLLQTARGVVDGHLKRAQAIDAKLQ